MTDDEARELGDLMLKEALAHGEMMREAHTEAARASHATLRLMAIQGGLLLHLLAELRTLTSRTTARERHVTEVETGGQETAG